MGIPILALIDRAFDALREADYRDTTIYEYKKTFAKLAILAESLNKDSYDSVLGKDFVSDTASEKTGEYSFYRWKRRNQCVRMLDYYLEHGKFRLGSFFEHKDVMPATATYQDLLMNYAKHLEGRSLSASMVYSCRHMALEFLMHLEASGHLFVDTVAPKDIYDFIVVLREKWSESGMRSAICALHPFMAFMDRRDLEDTVKGIRTVKTRSIIPTLSCEEQSALWDALDVGGGLMARDRTIVLLSLLMGMRACDIVNLRLKDINWRSGHIAFTQTKTKNTALLPLLPVVGNALSEYILNERPTVGFDHVFISKNAPHCPLSGHTSCYVVVKKAFRVAGIDMRQGVCGTRLLRHNAATRMLKSGAAVEVIAAVLGHVDIDSTELYLSVDEEGLRICTLPLPKIPTKTGGIS
jgi:site-specific recombinase XerD